MLFCALAIACTSCNTTKRLASDELLLADNEIKLTDNIAVDKDALSNLVRQQPNRKIFGIFPLYVWAYNVPNPDKFESRNAKRREKLEKKNAKRLKKGKDPKELKPFGSWWRETVGEAPVVYDSSITSRSAEQLQTYLVKHGWFDASVSTQEKPNYRKQRMRVVYNVTGRTPYKIQKLDFRISDESIQIYTDDLRKNRNTLKPGSQFNIDALDDERDALNMKLRNLGYYNFNKELIYFDVDSALNNHTVHLTMGVIPRKIPYSGDPDSLLTVPYRKYTIDRINIIDRPLSRQKEIPPIDTLKINDYTIIDQHQLEVKPKVLAQNTLFKTEEYYQIDQVTRTYRRLTALPIVSSASIRFEPTEDSEENNRLNCTINLTPDRKQNFAFEWSGTNRGGFLGIAGTVSYQNKNIFGGAEKLDINVSGGAEAQQLLTASGTGNNNDGNVRNNFNLNTIEFGPEIALTFPRFLLPIKTERFAKSADPKTILTANLSYQRRPDYERTRSFGSIAYKWSESSQKKWSISPVEVSLIKIFRSEAFNQQLQQIGDLFLINSFQDHFIVDSKIAYTFNTQNTAQKGKNFYFYHGELESAGNVLRGLFELSAATADTTGSYQILNIPFAQYIKTQHDFRYYRNHNEKMSTAYRLSGGIGVPLKNLNVLPFEKSFFGGGANDIRAWQARTLGPGSFRDPERSFDKIGDILLEANIEYRFDLIDVLEGALFLDAGNIWTINADPARPGADFETSRFIREIAFGAGTGMRLNFDFFLIRLDVALQIKDPSLDPGERWLFQPKDQYNSYIENLNESRPVDNQLSDYSWRWNLNIGIGYPF